MQIGKIDIKNPLVLAPMEDITEIPFRLICKSLGADILYSEFVSSEGLARNIKKVSEKLQFLDIERPIGLQIFGSIERAIEQAIHIAEQRQPDFIDINCGCWVKNFVRRGEGAALLKDLKRFEAIIQAAVKSTTLPVTVKTRLGWDKNNIVILEAAKIAEQSGAKALTVHCRTRDQAHQGQADWSWLEKIKKSISIPLIGNGDIKTPLDVAKMFETGCDGVMIGQASLNNPWLFQQAKEFLKSGAVPPEPSIEDRIRLCIKHLKLSLEHKGPWYGVVNFRKHYGGYLRGVPHVSKLRHELMPIMDTDAIIKRLEDFLENQTIVSSRL